MSCIFIFPFFFALVTILDWPSRLYRATLSFAHPTHTLLPPQPKTGFFWSADFLEWLHSPSPSCRPTTQIFLLMYRGPLSFHTGIWSLEFESWALYHNLLYQGALLSWYVGIERNGHVQSWLRSWWWPKVKPPGMEGGARKTQKKLEQALWMDWMDRGDEIVSSEVSWQVLSQ